MNTKQRHNLRQSLNLTLRQVSTGLAQFHVCYVIFDMPANLIMRRLSLHVRMSRIVIGVGSCMAAIEAAWSF
jgi:aerobic-type carbon monoxide dehydrogenase small subunit (CoxS/CutS family)